MNIKRKNLIVITGPTAIGKTALSIDIAKEFNAEIISADSRQFYSEMKIGTAPPSPEELNQVKHHFIASLSIKDYYSAGRYEEDALKTLNKLFEKDDCVVMVGGSGMYVDILCSGMDNVPGKDANVREDLDKIYEDKGIEELNRMLNKLDSEYYNQADLNNPKRILRALEICISTGKPYSSFRTDVAKIRPFNIIKIALNMDRDLLYERINKRVDIMVEQGLEEEARNLYKYKDLNALNTVGYKEIFPYFEGEYSFKKAIELIKRNTRRFAKRQLTWLRRDKSIAWFNPNEKDEIIEFISAEIK